jgi:hypothetical protein
LVPKPHNAELLLPQLSLTATLQLKLEADWQGKGLQDKQVLLFSLHIPEPPAVHVYSQLPEVPFVQLPDV